MVRVAAEMGCVTHDVESSQAKQNLPTHRGTSQACTYETSYYMHIGYHSVLAYR